ncbi:MAG TPA: hypothetical protein VGD64_15325, partial [Acidisarcina sp.]
MALRPVALRRAAFGAPVLGPVALAGGVVFAAVLFCGASSAGAQASPSQTPLVPGSGGSSSSPSSSASSSTINDYPDLQHRGVDIESSQPGAHEQYLLGGGDEIVVTVLGRPELSGT